VIVPECASEPTHFLQRLLNNSPHSASSQVTRTQQSDTITALKNELADKTQAREKFQTDTKTLSRVVEVFKKTADQLPAYVPSLDAHVKTLNNTITNLNTELHAGELSLEWTTATKDDFQHQSTRLTKKLEGMCPLHCRLSLSYVLC
jgi:chromosome segregation ATPase